MFPSMESFAHDGGLGDESPCLAVVIGASHGLIGGRRVLGEHEAVMLVASDGSNAAIQ